jgi:Na+(H+)/acetate symporter ActP
MVSFPLMAMMVPFILGWTGGYVLLALLLAPISENLGNLLFQILLEKDSNTARTV